MTNTRVLVVTGGASGIGRALSEIAAGLGWMVAVLDLPSALARRRGLSGVGIPCDVSDEAQVVSAFARVSECLGPVDALFCSAGIDEGGLLHEMTYDRWRKVLAVNLDGTFLCVREAIRLMVGQGLGGSIVCCSSPASFVGLAAGGASAYSASKGGISALVRSVAVDYAGHGIRVNALVPGATETSLMWANVPAAELSSTHEMLTKEIPLRRLAQPSEPAAAAMWLLSEESRYVTGSHLVIDGGILAKASISV